MIRPAREGWARSSIGAVEKINKDKGKKKAGLGGLVAPKDLMEALWKPPQEGDGKPEEKQLTSLEQATIDAIGEKTRYPAYEVLIRVVVSSNTAAHSQVLLKNIVNSSIQK